MRDDPHGAPLSQAAGPGPPHRKLPMVGPLFYHEMLLGSRRSRDYVFRWVYAGWLLVQLSWFAFLDSFLYSFFTTPPNQDYTNYVGRHFAEVFIPQHFIL